MNIAEEIGQHIRYYRKQKQMSIEELAAAVCKSKSCVSKYENGQIAVDVLTLYDIAAALEIRVTQLLCLSPGPLHAAPAGMVPAFFAGLSRFYLYYFDGRSNHIVRCVADISQQNEKGAFAVQVYMNVPDYQRYQLSENTYEGELMHYGTLSMILLQNQNMEMDHYQIGIPSPFMNSPTKWGLAFGISSRPLMPTSTKILLSKQILPESPELEKELRISKEDIRLMRLYNMLTVL